MSPHDRLVFVTDPGEAGTREWTAGSGPRSGRRPEEHPCRTAAAASRSEAVRYCISHDLI
ncbi:hypothetical protein PQJ75_08435 [Rhodoplanes sp. TEM]|uniref:Uncharacterized protein n=1 Tax=Rhodoplanes tepidamans TaxID=200616 RepID=A0ABT5JAN4_RHOTP|nr:MULTISPECIES: hypothetical protein [Rhodoplanes]MDC7786748.1 hypothetical protein [Rhodoplanes tepidamans]MDC7983754.1 hypothetical protein [Rhodoplanes sp. TEM]MDQ0358185.1 hypothetical protein [Rhodoplanes tepidamans]